MSMKDTGGQIHNKRALSPQAISGSTIVNGAVMDRKGYQSGVATFISGATSGTPTSFSMALKVQHGDASDGSDMADVTTAQNNDEAVTGTIIAVNTEKEINVDFRQLKRYVRVCVTPTFVSGTAPTLLVGANLSLGECYLNPAS